MRLPAGHVASYCIGDQVNDYQFKPSPTDTHGGTAKMLLMLMCKADPRAILFYLTDSHQLDGLLIVASINWEQVIMHECVHASEFSHGFNSQGSISINLHICRKNTVCMPYIQLLIPMQ